MIATLSATTQIRIRPPMQDRSFTLSSNSAGSPLPLIPRRSPARAHSTPNPTVRSLQLRPASFNVVVHASSPESEVSQAGSSLPNTALKNLADAPESSSPPMPDTSQGSPTLNAKKLRRGRSTSIDNSSSGPTPPILHEKGNSRQAPVEGLPLKSAEKRSPSSPHPLLYDPTQPLHINLGALKGRTLSASNIEGLPSSESPLASGRTFSLQPAPLVRNKSGQLVKSSLKGGSRPGTPGRASLTVVTRGPPSKSEPTTPKAVHFDAKLEHVKLFLAEQKPLAVSRDGSPTDDTSGTESDFPSFIYGSADERRIRRALSIRVVDMPSVVDTTADIALEKLELAPGAESINGTVRVRNIAFHKQVVARFTLDAWQTTSEVAGRYIERINTGFDRFGFSLRLNDLVRIESKTLILALRYNVDGREIWDNNGTHNYHVVFSTAPQPREQPQKYRRGAALGTQEDEDSASDIADLKRKLERVVRSREVGDSQQPQLSRRVASRSTPPSAMRSEHNSSSSSTASNAPRSAARRRRSPPSSRSGSSSSSENEKPLEFKAGSGSGFGTRYDLGSSLRAPWKAHHSRHHHQSHQPLVQRSLEDGRPQRLRMNSYPATVSPPSSIPWPEKLASSGPLRSQSLGSPRDLDDDEATRLHMRHVVGECDESVQDLGYFQMQPGARRIGHGLRNHTRGADASSAHLAQTATGVRRTPPGTPTTVSKELDDEDELGGAQKWKSIQPLEVPRSPRILSPVGGLSARSISFPPMDGSIFVSPTTSPVVPAAVPPVILGMKDASMNQTLVGVRDGSRDDAVLANGLALGPTHPPKKLTVDVHGGDSEDSMTPTFFSSSGSSRSSTPSPTEAFMLAKITSALDDGIAGRWSPPADYHQFLDRFCFYTGADSAMPARAQGEGTVDDLFAMTAHSPRLAPFGSASEQLFADAQPHSAALPDVIPAMPPMPPRAASDDALLCRSGSATPTLASAPHPASLSVQDRLAPISIA